MTWVESAGPYAGSTVRPLRCAGAGADLQVWVEVVEGHGAARSIRYRTPWSALSADERAIVEAATGAAVGADAPAVEVDQSPEMVNGSTWHRRADM